MSISAPTATPPETVIAPEPPTWTGRLRSRAVGMLPPEKLLPDRQPAYVASWIYIFGALTLAAFGIVLLSGAVIAIKGPSWYHVSGLGLYMNSLHLWGTELFFFFMVVHLWGKFFMAAWRGRRRATWITGVLAFLTSIGTAFTGYLSQQNFDSEWISTQAKDGINATGAGAFWNVLNFGQMLMWHILLLPLIVAVIVGLHVLQVRRHGVVPPFAVTTAAGSATSGFAAEPIAAEPIAAEPIAAEPIAAEPIAAEPIAAADEPAPAPSPSEEAQ
ncbi:MAG: cytochrome b N-terminal domain-containing protein [Acidimicrobiales bacterium]